VVRGFAEAMAKGDADGAKAFLPDDAACGAAKPDLADECKKSAAAMRDQIGGMMDDFPKGAKVKDVKKSDEPVPFPDAAIWEVTLEVDGKDLPGELFTVKYGDQYYAGFPIKG
jgi:hypothetical protein